MMRHISELEAEVPAEQFCDRKCTFLELFQVPGTPIFLKICRELDPGSIRVFQRPTQVVFTKTFSFKHFEPIKF
ncbi:hypothetical protein CsSME_00028578 [Camellia sinensis var. sinensis]